jgi:outer membrane immunogenic protein
MRCFRTTLFFTAIAASLGLINPASAADLPARSYTKAPVMEAPIYDWTGFYFGGAIGGVWSNANRSTTCQEPGDPFVRTCTFAPDRFANNNPRGFGASSAKAGIYGGANWQLARTWLVGLEGDVNWLDLHRTNAGIPGLENPTLAGAPGTDSSSVRQSWDGSLRGRVGVLLTPSVLLYGTGGVAFTHVDVSAHCGTSSRGWCVDGDLGRTDTSGFDRAGWTLGAGAEAMIAPNWLLRGQYLYADYGTLNFTQLQNPNTNNASAYSGSVRYHAQSAMIGIAYKFGGPVAAKY